MLNENIDGIFFVIVNISLCEYPNSSKRLIFSLIKLILKVIKQGKTFNALMKQIKINFLDLL